MEKILLVVFDGLGDRPVSVLNGKTPLEAAVKPNLDALAARGMVGLVHTVGVGIRPGSDVAHLGLLGYDPHKYYCGRGPFEAAGYGLDLAPGDVAMRGNFGTVDKDMVITDRRAGRIDDASELVKAFDGMEIDGVKILLKAGVGHRVAVVFRGPGLDSGITEPDPHRTGVKVREAEPVGGGPAARATAGIVNRFIRKTREILSGQPLNAKRMEMGLPPANIILLRGPGMLAKFPPFADRFGMKAACVAGAGLYKGISRLLGFDIISVPGATGKPDTDVSAKVQAALTAFGTHQFVFLHLKGTDVLAEDKNPLGKKEFIEKADKAFGLLMDRKDMLIAVTGDHSTASALGMHTADPVPLLISGTDIRTDRCGSFGETGCAAGSLGHIMGVNLMPVLIDQLGKAPLYGA